jgi:predicted transcriptional regulator
MESRVDEAFAMASFKINGCIDNLKMSELSDLLFVFASLDRLTLFSEIGREKMKLTQLTSLISATPQETSKHLIRLRNAGTIEKDSEGFFAQTSFGKILHELLPALRFANKNQRYLLSHDMALLPLEFIERLGELQESEYTEGVGKILSHTQQAVREAEEYIWLMADHPIGGEEFIGGNMKLEASDVKWRIIIPGGNDFAPSSLHYTYDPRKGKRIEFGLMKESKDIKAGIVLNERTAGLTLPDLNGRLDFNSGFRSGSTLFHKWCFDLFNYHWHKTCRKIAL